MEIDTDENEYDIKGGRTILGKIFSYQERTGMSIREIMKIPYIQFVIGMLDAPQIDYNSKKDKKKKGKPKNKKNLTQQEELNLIAAALK